MSTSSCVSRLLVRSKERDSPALRLRLESALGAAEWRLRSGSPSAVLLVKRLSVLEPVSGDRIHLRSWSQALEAQISAWQRRAARPEGGPIPSDVEAVLFSDRAEWLAAALGILARGERCPWWAEGLAPGAGRGETATVSGLLGEHVDVLAPTLGILHERGEAVAVIRQVAAAGALKLLEATLEHHDVTVPTRETGRQAISASATPALNMPHQGSGRMRAPPWRARLPALEARALGREQEALLGTALVLEGSPTAGRNPRLSQDLKAWLESGRREERSAHSPGREAFSPAPSVEGPPRAVPGAQAPRFDMHALPRGQGSDSRGSAEIDESGPEKALTDGDVTPQGGLRASGEDGRLTAVEKGRQGAETEGVLTDVGGVLFLINYLGRLERAVADPAADLELTGPLRDFALVGFLGLHLLRQEGLHFDSDPLWRELARLARLPESAPLEPAWLEHGCTRERFVSDISPLWERRLREELGMATDHSLAEALLLRRGRLFATATHVDLVMDLEDATLPVREAGLDQDPGWVPELGRVITFHYETSHFQPGDSP